MNTSGHKIKQTVIATAIAATIGTSAISRQVSADILYFDMTGVFTLIDSGGTPLGNFDAPAGGPWYQNRTPVAGTMAFDTDTNSGTLTMQPFAFAGGGNVVVSNISIQDVDGAGGAGTLMLGNMEADWSGSNGIPISIVWDGAGLLDAISQGLTEGDTIAGSAADYACDTIISCATPASSGYVFGTMTSYTLPIGPSPIATTTWNTTTIGGGAPCPLGCNPSGTLPLIADTIGGSPMPGGPFPGWNANFDFDRLTVISAPDIGLAIDIGVTGGNTQECTAPDGKEISMEAVITVPDDDAVDTVSWRLDGEPVASGVSVVIPIPLGTHTLQVTVATILGNASTDTESVTVVDTTGPVINAAFLDSKTGAEITTIKSKHLAEISISVSDTCDTAPVSSATAGLPVFDGDRVRAHRQKMGSGAGLTIRGGADNIEVTVTAGDASGNASNKKATLTVIE